MLAEVHFRRSVLVIPSRSQWTISISEDRGQVQECLANHPRLLHRNATFFKP